MPPTFTGQPPPEPSLPEADAAHFTPGLYLVATPIGNAADITLRALALLRRADLVCCEDSRVTGPFLKRYVIGTPLFPYHEHNAAKVERKSVAHGKSADVRLALGGCRILKKKSTDSLRHILALYCLLHSH